jgi:GWxTD domain-containing protein
MTIPESIRRTAAVLILSLLSSLRIQASEKFRMDADYAQFRYDQNAVFIEIYYQAPPSSMVLQVEKDGAAWADQRWQNGDTTKADKAKTPVGTNLGRAYFVAPAGHYRVRLEAQDLGHPDQKAGKEFQLDVVPFPIGALAVSDIELASEILNGEPNFKDNPFFKNSLLVVPRPTLVFGMLQPILYYYVEIYNVLAGIPSSSYTLQASVVDSSGQIVRSMKPTSQKKKKIRDSVVEFGEIGLFSLSAGAYYLKISVLDSLNGEITAKKKKFYVFHPEKKEYAAPTSNLLFESSPFYTMDEKSIKLLYEQSRYLMTGQQKSIFKSLQGPDPQRKYLYEFWRALDPDPSTAANEFYEEYIKRIEYADQNFGTIQKKGWETDRGRVYLAYGPPNDVERFPSESQLVPYEIWHYDAIEGGVIFVFAELSGYKNYVLLHSTKTGEVSNTDYMRMIQRGF